MSKWKDIIGFEGKYECNGFNIRSVPRKNVLCYRILKPTKKHGGYLYYNLYVKKPKKIDKLEHRLVWEHYFGPIPKHLQINHKNGIKDQNNIENLELVTPKQNNWHKENVLGKHQMGERSGNCKLSDNSILKIKKMLSTKKYSQKKIASIFGVSQSHICKINLGLRRKLLTNEKSELKWQK